MEITPADWRIIRRVFQDGFASGFHFSVASVGEDGAPRVAPIGSILLGEPGHAVYFEEYARGLAHDLQRDPRVCVMALNGSRWELLKALWRGEVRRPFGVRLHGTAGERREATAAERELFQRRVRHLRFLRGHRLLWGKLRVVRPVRFHAFDPRRSEPRRGRSRPARSAGPSWSRRTAPRPRPSPSP